MNFSLVLQPKQSEIWEMVENGTSTWIGMYGGRGGAKSGAMQRIMIARRLQRKGTVGCILMRNSDQVKRYHENVMLRTWPDLERCYKATERKLVLPFRSGPPSEIQFTYADVLADVIRRFRSANYYDIFIDQAEQFTEAELREIKQAVRWPQVPMGTCKLLLCFNMGGAGIGFMRKKFHTLEYGPRERAEDFSGVHVGPYDNVEWVRPALEQDGLTAEDYYGWSIGERKTYCATKSDYGSALVSQDEALVQRDFDGSWDSLEGAYFARSWDRDAAVIETDQVRKLIKPWWEHWMSQDWGRGHYTVTYWHARGEISPQEAKKVLGWEIRMPIKLAVTYRELVSGGEAAADGGGKRLLNEGDVAREIVRLTPPEDRDKIRDFVLSPDAFHKRTSENTIAEKIGAIMTESGLAYPRIADDNRKGGWALMSELLLSTKRRGQLHDDAWVISANCVELIAAIPLAMRELTDLDDITKTDKSRASVDADSMDSCRYGLQTMLRPGTKPKEQIVAEEVKRLREEEGLDEHSLSIISWRMQHENPDSGDDMVMGRSHGSGRIIRR